MTNEYDSINSLSNESQYSDIVRSISGGLTYSELPQYARKELNHICKPKKWLKTADCKLDPTVFAYHVVGIRPYLYQYLYLEHIRKFDKKISLCKSRQMGGSLILGLTALWAAYYNTMPSGLHKNTKILIISKSEIQAKKLLGEIKKLISMGDRNFAIRTGGKCVDVLSKELADNQPQTATQITFKNGSFIKSLAPTDSCRGETIDLLILDEAGFIEEELYYNVLEPTTSHTNGMIVMVSSPNGAQGLFYNIFDPENMKETNPYKRLWIPWTYCENVIQKAKIEERKVQWQIEGKMKNFQQEYEAKFTVAESSFFEGNKVDAAIEESLYHVLEWKSEPCIMGIDYGFRKSRTVITIVSKSMDGIVRERFQHIYDYGDDVSIEEDVDKLMKRFNIKTIVVDDCVGGYLTNEKMKNKGLPITLFNFRSDQNEGPRNRGYYVLRSKLNQGEVKITKNARLISELKSLVEIRKQINVSVKGAPGCGDDLSDSFCMACYHFLVEEDDDSSLIAGDVEPEKGDKHYNHPRYDKEWHAIQGGN